MKKYLVVPSEFKISDEVVCCGAVCVEMSDNGVSCCAIRVEISDEGVSCGTVWVEISDERSLMRCRLCWFFR